MKFNGIHNPFHFPSGSYTRSGYDEGDTPIGWQKPNEENWDEDWKFIWDPKHRPRSMGNKARRHLFSDENSYKRGMLKGIKRGERILQGSAAENIDVASIENDSHFKEMFPPNKIGEATMFNRDKMLQALKEKQEKLGINYVTPNRTDSKSPSSSSAKYFSDYLYDKFNEKQRAQKGFDPKLRNVHMQGEPGMVNYFYHSHTKNHMYYSHNRQRMTNDRLKQVPRPTALLTREQFLQEGNRPENTTLFDLPAPLAFHPQFGFLGRFFETAAKVQTSKRKPAAEAEIAIPPVINEEPWLTDVTSSKEFSQSMSKVVPTVGSQDFSVDSEFLSLSVLRRFMNHVQREEEKNPKKKSKAGPVLSNEQSSFLESTMNEATPRDRLSESSLKDTSLLEESSLRSGLTESSLKESALEEESLGRTSESLSTPKKRPSSAKTKSGVARPITKPKPSSTRKTKTGVSAPADKHSTAQPTTSRAVNAPKPTATTGAAMPAAQMSTHNILAYLNLQKKHHEEKLRVNQRLEEMHLMERRVIGDGNCQFRALAFLLEGTEQTHVEMRRKLVTWLAEHYDLVKDFHEGNWEQYLRFMATPPSWGDHFTLVAAANLFNIRICIVTSLDVEKGSSVHYVDPHPPAKYTKVIHLIHYHENHFNALVPKPSMSVIYPPEKNENDEN